MRRINKTFPAFTIGKALTSAQIPVASERARITARRCLKAVSSSYYIRARAPKVESPGMFVRSYRIYSMHRYGQEFNQFGYISIR